jgi:hypothetical protein
MAGRDPRSPDPDDWFADSERAPQRRGRPPARAGEPGADEDDWTAEHRRLRRPRPTFAASLPDQWVPLAAGALLVLILVIAGLALAGVFSSSTPAPTPPIASVSTVVTTPTTTHATAPTVAAPTTTLKPGDTGAQVKALQRALAQLGYSAGKVDGDYGTATKTALEQFQTASKLTADGLFGPATRTALIKALNSG